VDVYVRVCKRERMCVCVCAYIYEDIQSYIPILNDVILYKRKQADVWMPTGFLVQYEYK